MDETELAKNTEICRLAKNIVIGKGNLKAKIMFVGEAPGRNEDEQGLPFVGAAGKNLQNYSLHLRQLFESKQVTT